MKLLLRHQALLLIASGLVFFTFLGAPAVFNDEEAKNVACSAEMFRQGAWLTPTFNGQLRTDSPVLDNWLTLVAFRMLGVSEFAARVPSAILSLGTVLLTYHLGRKLFSSDIGFLAAMILGTCLLFSTFSRAGTPDSPLVFFVTCSLTSYVLMVTRQRGTNFCRSLPPKTGPRPPKPSVEVPNQESTESASEESPPRLSIWKRIFAGNWRFALLMYLPLGLAVLTSGPIPFLLTCITLLMFILVSQRYDDLENQTLRWPDGPWWRTWFIAAVQLFWPRKILVAFREINLVLGICVVTAIALPWYFSVTVATKGVWFQSFLIENHFGSVIGVNDGQEGFPLYVFYDLVLLLLGGFPWSVFLPVALNRLWERLSDGAAWRESDRLLACWFSVWFFACSLFITKLPDSLLPIYPAIALILARYFNDWKRGGGSFGVYSLMICCRAMWIAGTSMVLLIAMLGYLYAPTEQWLGIIGLVPVIGGLIAGRFLENDRRTRVMQTLITTALLLAILVVAIIPLRLRPYQDTPIFIAEARQFAKSADVKIGTYDYFEPSVVYYAGSNVHRLETPRQAADFLSGYHAFVIAKAKDYNTLRGEFAGGIFELSRRRNFFTGHELILIGRN